MAKRFFMHGAVLPFVLVLSVVLLSLTMVGVQAQRQFMRVERLVNQHDTNMHDGLDIVRQQQDIRWWLEHWAPDEYELAAFCMHYYISENVGFCLQAHAAEQKTWWWWELAANDNFWAEEDNAAVTVVVQPSDVGLPIWARRFYLERAEQEWRVANSVVFQMRHPVVNKWRHGEGALWWREASL